MKHRSKITKALDIATEIALLEASLRYTRDEARRADTAGQIQTRRDILAALIPALPVHEQARVYDRTLRIPAHL
jgi:hypothetical protein